MSLKRIWIMFKARNWEFFRDRASFGWNFLFPFLLVAGFGILFGGREYTAYKIGVFPETRNPLPVKELNLPEAFRETRFLQFVGFATQEEALEKLRHHKVDFVVRAGATPYRYWINATSPKGQLAMNMMFSALWGVGYIVVRYRKNGALRRLKATPLTAFEYLSAQMLSRLFLLMFTLLVVWFGCDLFFHFNVAGSLGDIFVMFFLGSLSLTSLGLVLASRGVSEEFTTGILNFISWPMMFLSEVWFSLEGAPGWVKQTAQVFPLTHLLTGIRKIMNDGVSLTDVLPEITVLLIMTGLFLSLGAFLFSWDR